jgi:trypsin
MLKSLLLLACAVCGCFSSEPENPKIVGGVELEIKSAPFIVLLIYNNRPLCGGSIISSNFILTAAHCTEDIKAKELKVQSGSKAVNEGKTYFVSHIFNHPKYESENFNFDFSLLRIFGKIFYNENQRAIALPEANDETPIGSSVRVMGWGRTMNPNESMNFLRVVKLILSDPKECEESYKEYDIKVVHNKVCATHPERKDGKDACQGDSGGPLQRIGDGKLIGVVSFGLGCAKKEYPGIYAKVSSARAWIKSVAKV